MGGLGDLGVLRAPLPRAGRRRAAGLRVERRRDARLRAHRRGRHRRRLRDGAVALDGAQRPLRRVPRSAARLRLRLLPAGPRCGGSKVVTADFKVDPPPLAGADRRPRDVDRGPHAGGREVGRANAERRRRGGQLEGPRPASRGRGRGRASPGGVDPAAVRRPPEGDHREHGLATHRATAQDQRGAPATEARLGLVAQGPADVFARDDRRVGRDPDTMAQAREALGEREGA